MFDKLEELQASLASLHNLLAEEAMDETEELEEADEPEANMASLQASMASLQATFPEDIPLIWGAEAQTPPQFDTPPSTPEDVSIGSGSSPIQSFMSLLPSTPSVGPLPSIAVDEETASSISFEPEVPEPVGQGQDVLGQNEDDDFAPAGLALELLHPLKWGVALVELDTLKDGVWLDGTPLDFWLCHLWLELGCPGGRYLSFEWWLLNTVEEEDILRFRETYHLPLEGPCELVPVVGILNTGQSYNAKDELKGGNHYCVVYWQPEEQRVHVLGMNYTENSTKLVATDWDEWSGPRIWRNIAWLHGWDCTEMTVSKVNWVQNGRDCGPIAAHVLLEIWTRGFQTREGLWCKPNLPCCHSMRIRMANEVHNHVVNAYNKYLHFVTAHHDHDFPMPEDVVMDELENHMGRRVRGVVDNLQRAMMLCVRCRQLLHVHTITRPVVSKTIPSQGQPGKEGKKTIDSGGSGDDDGQSDGQSPLVAQINKAKHVKDWTVARLGRFPRPNPPELPPLGNHRNLRLKFSDEFDDYEDGPTLETLDRIPDTIVQLASQSLVYLANQIVKSPWTMYKDYGWRLLPCYAHQFYNRAPVMVKEHLMPVGLASPTLNDYEDDPDSNDSCIMGAAEMIEEAENTDNPDIFLTGVTAQGLHIHLDLGKDAVQPEEIVVTWDIDSLIWVSSNPKFNHAVNVFLTPQIRHKAPIWKHNHVYVNLLLPPSEEDRERLGARTEYETKAFGLSQLPHISFGKLGDGSGLMNLYLVFPRMTHQQEYSGRWISMVPWDIQGQFWKKVVNPALVETMDDTYLPYMALSEEQVKFKTSAKGKGRKGAKAPTFPVKQEYFQQLLQHMRDLIRDCPDNSLAMFGSFFFVLEMKGSKLYTKEIAIDHQECLKACFEEFWREFPGLDFDYALDRSHGELYLDLGITYNAINPEPLVGLWRLDSLEASYGLAGYNMGTIHHLNTLNLYGGLQAEMQERRSQRNHIVLRSSYNLAYEVTRKLDNGRDLFDDKEAYHLDPNYLSEIDQVMNIYTADAGKRSYGVRDEFRVGGQPLIPFIEGADSMVEEMLASQPILWLPSSIWFKFLAQRMARIRATQQKLAETVPGNYGIMTGLLTFMLQSVLFTPTIISSHVRESLGLLRYKQVVDRFGMLFLHNLDLSQDNCLLEVLDRDDMDVLRTLGVKQKRKRIRIPSPEAEDMEEYPIGKTPSWKEVELCLKDTPWKLLRPFTWLPDFDVVGCQAEFLFKLFTTHIWAGLNEKWRTRMVIPGTLLEALESWTLLETHKTLTDAKYLACNAGLLGSIPGRRVKSFQERFTIYFPESAKGLTGIWKILAEPPGYISEYHMARTKLSEIDLDALHASLQLLLSKCQCLPTSQRSDSESGGHSVIWEVKGETVLVLTNPDFYKLARIGAMSKKRRIRRAPTHTGVKKLQMALLKQSGVTQVVARRAVNMSRRLKQHRSGKSKNRRVPPRKVQIQSEEEALPEKEKEQVAVVALFDEEAEEAEEEEEEEEVESEEEDESASEGEKLSPEEEDDDE